MKRGAIEISMMGQILIAVALLVVLLMLIWLSKEKSFDIIEVFKNIARIAK